MLALKFVAKERAYIFPKSAYFAKLENVRHVIYSLRSCCGSRQITYVTCNSQNQQMDVGCFLRLTLTYFCAYSKMLGTLQIHVDTVCCP